MVPITVFASAGLAAMLALAACIAGTAVYEHFSPPPAPTPDSIDD